MKGYNCILIDDSDNVVTALKNILKGEILKAIGLESEIIANENIKNGHKVAIRKILKDGEVTKYGKTIGTALSNVDIGYLVHTHNVRSNRGKELRGGR